MRLHRLARMQEHLRGADEQRDRDDAVLLLAVLALHLGAAGFVEPVQHVLGVEAAGVAAEQHRGRILAPVVAHPGVAHLGDAVLHRLGDLERVAERAAGEHLDLHAPAGEERHPLGERLGADVHQRAARPGGGHLPAVGRPLGLRCGGKCSQHAAAPAPAFRKSRFFMVLLLRSLGLGRCDRPVDRHRRVRPAELLDRRLELGLHVVLVVAVEDRARPARGPGRSCP